ncbi:hypothetical protein P7K49_008969, partial [Saguinus oedipus]
MVLVALCLVSHHVYLQISPEPALLLPQPFPSSPCPVSAAQYRRPVPLTPHPTSARTTYAQNPLLAFCSGDPSKPGPHLSLQKECATLFLTSALESLNSPQHTLTCLHPAPGSSSLLTPLFGATPLPHSHVHGQAVHKLSLTELFS